MDNAPIYDDLEAIDFIVRHTGVPLEDAQKFLEARTRYQMLIGVFPVDGEDREEIEEQRRVYADLLRGGEFDVEYEDLNSLLTYVRKVTGLSAAGVADMIAEETAYMVQIKVMFNEAYTDIRKWADDIIVASEMKAPLR